VGQDPIKGVGERALGSWEIAVAGLLHDPDHDIVECGQYLWGLPTPHLAGIFL
jgi:hypothetical protein